VPSCSGVATAPGPWARCQARSNGPATRASCYEKRWPTILIWMENQVLNEKLWMEYNTVLISPCLHATLRCSCEKIQVCQVAACRICEFRLCRHTPTHSYTHACYSQRSFTRAYATSAVYEK
jgi:hypothetical protein